MRTPLAVLAAGFAGAALAQSTTLGTLDTDRDGSISRYEASAMPGLVTQFSALDANGDGALESAEFSRFEATGDAPVTGVAPVTPAPPMGNSPAPDSISPAPAGSLSPAPTGSTPAPSGSTPAPSGSTTPPPPR